MKSKMTGECFRADRLSSSLSRGPHPSSQWNCISSKLLQFKLKSREIEEERFEVNFKKCWNLTPVLSKQDFFWVFGSLSENFSIFFDVATKNWFNNGDRCLRRLDCNSGFNSSWLETRWAARGFETFDDGCLKRVFKQVCHLHKQTRIDFR